MCFLLINRSRESKDLGGRKVYVGTGSGESERRAEGMEGIPGCCTARGTGRPAAEGSPRPSSQALAPTTRGVPRPGPSLCPGYHCPIREPHELLTFAFKRTEERALSALSPCPRVGTSPPQVAAGPNLAPLPGAPALQGGTPHLPERHRLTQPRAGATLGSSSGWGQGRPSGSRPGGGQEWPRVQVGRDAPGVGGIPEGRAAARTHCLGSCRAGAPRRWKAPSTKTPFLPRHRR